MLRKIFLFCATIASTLLCALPAHADGFVRIVNDMDAPDHVCFCVRAYGKAGAKDGRYACTSQYGQYAESVVSAGAIRKIKVTAFRANACNNSRAYGKDGNHLVSRIVPEPGKPAYKAKVKQNANGKYEILLDPY